MQRISKANVNRRYKAPSTDAVYHEYLPIGSSIEVTDILLGTWLDGTNIWFNADDKFYYWSGGFEGCDYLVTEALTKSASTLVHQRPEHMLFDYGALIEGVSAFSSSKGEGVNVALLDSGFNLKNNTAHTDFNLSTVILKGNHTGDHINDVRDVEGHGIHLAGIIAANHSKPDGVKGIAPKCRLHIYRIAKNNTVKGVYLAPVLKELLKNPPHVINMSFDLPEAYFLALADMLEELSHKSVIIAAAGNNKTLWSDRLFTLAMLESVIAVGSLNQFYAAFAAKRSINSKIDCILPAYNYFSCANDGNYIQMDDCSTATAIVSGVVATLIANNPALVRNPAGIRNELNKISVPLQNYKYNSFRILKP